MDAELHLKREAQRDEEYEIRVAKWIEEAVGEPLADVNDLWVSLKSGVVLCELINAIVPGTIKKYARTNLLPLMEMDNIQLYLKACWNLGKEERERHKRLLIVRLYRCAQWRLLYCLGSVSQEVHVTGDPELNESLQSGTKPGLRRLASGGR